MDEKLSYIFEVISAEQLYLGLAEEAAELAAASAKVARILNGSNPAGKSLQAAMDALEEEISDTVLYLNVLGLKPSTGILEAKTERWIGRLMDGRN